MTNYSEQVCDWLIEEGYTHCFFVAGGNIMHLLNSARSRFKCIPVVHEVAAGIACEYFNETSGKNRAFVLVTAGPGLTNLVTAIAGAWLESRELLILGGQVKSSDLSDGKVRQNGIQEINGMDICKPITKKSIQIRKPISKKDFREVVQQTNTGRPGPVYFEFCLDAQAAKPVEETNAQVKKLSASNKSVDIDATLTLMNESCRPVILIGGGVSREIFNRYKPLFDDLKIPIMTTWNGIDRIDAQDNLYWGRPNTWGQRYSNILIQQSDLIIALGSRLGIQQTGFNWKNFAPLAKIIQVEVDINEIQKGHPKVDLGIHNTVENFLLELKNNAEKIHLQDLSEWIDFGKKVKNAIPLNESSNKTDSHFVSPYLFIEELSKVCTQDDIVIPCSSGGAFTTTMQAFSQKLGQKIVSNKGLASMGYGLAGAIGASYANPGKRVVLIEGDGGFAQNIQELGSVSVSNLPIKIFIYSNTGYASIKMTQLNYFQGSYIGCDISTGLGLPKDWVTLFESYGIEAVHLESKSIFPQNIREKFESTNPVAFIVPIDPEQTYYPKITSVVVENGQMESNPLHLMAPALDPALEKVVFKYLEI
jgi:acetolactate synthase-1/2/3 large subunit